MPTRKDLMNEAYDAALITLGVTMLGLITKKLMGEKIVAVESLKDAAKLAAGITASNIAVKYAQDMKWIPSEPFKST